MPSIGLSEPVPEKLKLPKTSFGDVLHTSLKRAGLNCSPFLILTNLLCFLERKIHFHLKATLFFQFSTTQFFMFFARYYLSFFIFLC